MKTEELISWLMRGLTGVVMLLIALFSWIATDQLRSVNTRIDALWPTITETKNIATNADKSVAVVSAKLDDLSQRVHGMESRSIPAK